MGSKGLYRFLVISGIPAIVWCCNQFLIAPMQTKIEQLQLQLRLSQQSLSEATVNYHKAAAEVTVRQGEVEALKEKLQESAKRSQQVPPNMQELVRERDALSESNERLRQQVASLEEKFRRHLDESTGTAEQLRTQLKQAQDRLDDAQRQLARSRDGQMESEKLRQQVGSLEERIRKQSEEAARAAEGLRSQWKQAQDKLDDAQKQLASSKFTRQRWERFGKFYKSFKSIHVSLTSSDVLDIFGEGEELRGQGGNSIWVYRDSSGNQYRVNFQAEAGRKLVAGLVPLP